MPLAGAMFRHPQSLHFLKGDNSKGIFLSDKFLSCFFVPVLHWERTEFLLDLFSQNNTMTRLMTDITRRHHGLLSFRWRCEVRNTKY